MIAIVVIISIDKTVHFMLVAKLLASLFIYKSSTLLLLPFYIFDITIYFFLCGVFVKNYSSYIYF